MLSILLAGVLTVAHPKETPAAAILSRRALKNARLLIQLKLLELREERLECVRQALLRRLPPELLTGSPGPDVKQSDALSARAFQSEECLWSSIHQRRRRAG